jgi:hypothetical protein
MHVLRHWLACRTLPVRVQWLRNCLIRLDSYIDVLSIGIRYCLGAIVIQTLQSLRYRFSIFLKRHFLYFVSTLVTEVRHNPNSSTCICWFARAPFVICCDVTRAVFVDLFDMTSVAATSADVYIMTSCRDAVVKPLVEAQRLGHSCIQDLLRSYGTCTELCRNV